jgi:hypothetical protein
MMRYLITYKKKGERPLSEGKMSTQLIDAKSREEIFPKLYERLHVREEQFREKFDIVDILEV